MCTYYAVHAPILCPGKGEVYKLYDRSNRSSNKASLTYLHTVSKKHSNSHFLINDKGFGILFEFYFFFSRVLVGHVTVIQQSFTFPHVIWRPHTIRSPEIC